MKKALLAVLLFVCQLSFSQSCYWKQKEFKFIVYTGTLASYDSVLNLFNLNPAGSVYLGPNANFIGLDVTPGLILTKSPDEGFVSPFTSWTEFEKVYVYNQQDAFPPYPQNANNYVTMSDTVSTIMPRWEAEQAIGLINDSINTRAIANGNSTQYIKGDGTKSTFPTSLSSFTNSPGYLTPGSLNSTIISNSLGYTPYNGTTNPNAYLTTSGARTAISLTTTGTSGLATYNSGTGILNIPNYGNVFPSIGTSGQLLRVNSGATALEYFSPSYLTGNQSITLSGDISGSGTTTITTTLGNSGITAGSYFRTTFDAKGRATAGLNWTIPTSTGARSFNTAYRESTTNFYSVTVSPQISCNLSLAGGQGGTITLEISANGTSGWIPVGILSGSNTGTLTVGLNTTQISGGQLSYDVPATYYWRLTTANTTGSPTYTYNGGTYKILQ